MSTTEVKCAAAFDAISDSNMHVLCLRGGGLIKAKSKAKHAAKKGVKKGQQSTSKVWWIADELKAKPKGARATDLDQRLLAACSAGNATEAELLAEQGADINCR